MCQQKRYLLLPRNHNERRTPSLGQPGRQLPVPESTSSLSQDDCKIYEMEGGDILPSTQMIPPSIIQQTPLQHLGEGKHNEYVPVTWETQKSQDSINPFGKSDRHLYQSVSSNKKRPVSDVGVDLQNRWKLKKEHSKAGLANRSLPERNSNLSFQVIVILLYLVTFQANI